MPTTKTTPPPLADGERYLCGIVNADGSITHSILLPGNNDPADWKTQMAWAKSIGGDLLNRAELVIAYETMPEEFKKQAYWSNTNYASAGWAWYQHFFSVYQSLIHPNGQLRARAVRRLII
jgi:hypothetical protein